MGERLDIAWRTAATGLCFATFGVGGLMLRTLVFPVLGLMVTQPARRQRWARACISRAFRLFVRLMCGLGVMSIEIVGAERLQRRGLLILANHPTLIDVVLLMSLVDGADCIVKASLAHNPFTRGPVRAAGFVCNDSGPAMVEDCVGTLQRGHNLIVFPEGTRTPRTGARPLQRGAANIAVRGRWAVTPVRICAQPLTLAKGDRWYRVPPRRMHMRLEVGPDIPVAPFLADGCSDAVAARRLTDHLTDYFFDKGAHRAGHHH
ncbi:lysophospholipid acyltransferase family protein [Ideonella sp.]|uniref:lysophospholipid acyltransferase family protein n=1 Tax=Ideonella sp. TaxID=1929293 RepID=UPI0035B280A1